MLSFIIIVGLILTIGIVETIMTGQWIILLIILALTIISIILKNKKLLSIVIIILFLITTYNGLMYFSQF